MGWWIAQGAGAAGADAQPVRGARGDAQEAAEIYPSMYWFSLLKVPAASEFPLGPVQSQQQWLNTIKRGLPVVPRARDAGDAQGP